MSNLFAVQEPIKTIPNVTMTKEYAEKEEKTRGHFLGGGKKEIQTERKRLNFVSYKTELISIRGKRDAVSLITFKSKMDCRRRKNNKVLLLRYKNVTS